MSYPQFDILNPSDFAGLHQKRDGCFSPPGDGCIWLNEGHSHAIGDMDANPLALESTPLDGCFLGSLFQDNDDSHGGFPQPQSAHAPHQAEATSPSFTSSASAPAIKAVVLSEAAGRFVMSKTEVDKALAADLSRLSVEEREQAMDDLHGISFTSPASKRQQEDPETMAKLLEEMQEYFDSVRLQPESAAYTLAVQIDAQYVKDQRMMFLRAERYCPSKAAQRMIRFFDFKLDLWGSERLCRKITLHDFGTGEWEALLNHPVVQVSPYKDTAGRLLFYSVPTALSKYRNQLCHYRAQYYVYMSTMEEDELAQKTGQVWVIVDCPVSYTSGGFRIRDSLPICHKAIHTNYIQDAPFSKAAITKIQATKLMSLDWRVRFRTYYCSRMEFLYQLMSFGIPREAAPLAKDGSISFERARLWIRKRMEIENVHGFPNLPARSITPLPGATWPSQDDSFASSPSTTATCLTATTTMTGSSNFSNNQGTAMSPALSSSTGKPSSPIPVGDNVIDDANIRNDDVLFGKEKKIVNHPGNTRFRQLVDMYIGAYESAPRGEKANITNILVDQVHMSSGRFLKRAPCGKGWVEVNTETAHDKITHAFRNRRKYHAQRAMAGTIRVSPYAC
mmetsp:Transcript_985/g.1791  ORF Transcript_985/g.1791 Transcript_985/m.1791 type:complete len:619 (-) Transcript_985:1089-2945(-)|eukprot:CAMPEP_0178787886 /NCGR_PEP_ID=MMETSP0745-20121128/6091_1 /TAXON_ID=913974 /ORGANISM="Nitzschia punctata, Strain CCMP561" /LENGTH=618 /DNA_ID=CAMNT_0020445761 /DNA_START=169 /DNA_END=2025 /DNA_ORIENTATION=+